MPLYHASPSQGVEVLEPSRKSRHQDEDVPRVYAAPSPVIAVAFIVGPSDDWAAHGSYDGGLSWTLVLGNENQFWARESEGGSIYVVSSEKFNFEPGVGLGKDEWFSKESVEVLSEERWSSAFAAMLHYSLKVFFLADGRLEKFKLLPGEDRWALLQRAQPQENGTFNIVW